MCETTRHSPGRTRRRCCSDTRATAPAHTLDHLAHGITAGAADAVLAASILHFGEYGIAEAKRHMAGRGIEVRH